jgi:hypothetical protein
MEQKKTSVVWHSACGGVGPAVPLMPARCHADESRDASLTLPRTPSVAHPTRCSLRLSDTSHGAPKQKIFGVHLASTPTRCDVEVLAAHAARDALSRWDHQCNRCDTTFSHQAPFPSPIPSHLAEHPVSSSHARWFTRPRHAFRFHATSPLARHAPLFLSSLFPLPSFLLFMLS